MKKIFTNKKTIPILFGFLFASSFYLYLEYRYEKKTLNAFIESIYNTKGVNKYDDESVVLAAMNKTHQQMLLRETSAMDLDLNTFEKFFTSPILQFALTKNGACGGNTLVLAQILNGMGYKVRPAQMYVNGKYGGHIVLEAEIQKNWVVFDPLYNLSFKNPNGTLASFKDVQTNWHYFKAQLPNNYPTNYNYFDVRYTNWDKLPYVGNAIKSVAAVFVGNKAVNTFSFRSYYLNPKKILFTTSFVMLIICSIIVLNIQYLKIHITLPTFKHKPKLNTTLASS